MSNIKPDLTGSEDLPASSIKQPANDFSNVQFKQTREERNRQGGGLWKVMFVAVLVIGALMAKDMLRSPVGSGNASGSGSLEPDRFISCLNNNSGRLDQFQRRDGSRDQYISADGGMTVIFPRKEGQADVSISRSGAAPERFASQAVVAIHCASGLNRNDSGDLYLTLLRDAERMAKTVGLASGRLEFEQKRYDLSLFAYGTLFITSL